MRLGQMFPSPTLDAEDLRAINPGVTVVAIESIQGRTKTSRQIGEMEMDYYLKVREFRKPMKLTKTCARQISQALGTDDTNQWFGRTIAITPAQVQVPDPGGGTKQIWLVNAEVKPPTTPPALPPNSDITGAKHDAQPGHGGLVRRPDPFNRPGNPATHTAQASPAGDMTPMGADKACEVLSGLHERGKTWDDLIKHMQSNSVGELIVGKIPPDAPNAVLVWARHLAKMFPKVRPPLTPAELNAKRRSWAPPPAASDVVDPATGEVLGPTGGDGYDEINEDDIPF